MLKRRVREIDLQAPSRIVERGDIDATAMFPLAIALRFVTAAGIVAERLWSNAAMSSTRHKISDRARERVWAQKEEPSYTKATQKSGARFAGLYG